MVDDQLERLLTFLDQLEMTESRSAAWGITDVGFTASELDELIAAYLDAPALKSDPWDERAFRMELIRRGLVVELEYPDGLLYRSRMAETIRLLASQRQLFEKHLTEGGWRSAPRLVADYRLLVRPRRYPVRNTPPELFESALLEEGTDDQLRDALMAILADRGGPTDFQLAAFQVRAAKEVLAAQRENRSGAVMVTAGTGSGKTLAFYLPVLALVEGMMDDSNWVKAVAVYPRNELLKDQFTETYNEVRRLDAKLSERGLRPIRIGAFFGPTPEYPAQVGQYKAWGRKIGAGFVCPFMRCPRCDGNLFWLQSDIREGMERLVCQAAGCGKEIVGGEVPLTRQTMAKSPPDLLFSTTEMLNQRFTDTRYQHLFGLGPRAPRKPRIALLDEVHTYEGAHGAQVGLLMRRWQQALDTPVVLVGLSATLRDAQSFFADLVGIRQDQVTVVEAEESEMTSEGMEYVLALRGDPNPQTSLLSTTIQTAVALGRCLEPIHSHRVPVFGKRIFLFTDDLDVTNRLYDNLRDAEGIDAFGNRIQRHDRALGALGNLRSPALPERAARLVDGQSWDMMEGLGYSLRPPEHLNVSRTSSQDAGVDSRSDIVVATAKLDVGYNDPSVGGVIQHKSPRAAAQFIQRKGRAGRVRIMRPWTVIVLSDYGRDRLNYQNYDQLFDPQLDLRRLPIRNRYILRMQAVFALMDWLGACVTQPEGYIWEDLKGPWRLRRQGSASRIRKRQEKILAEIDRLLTDPDRRADFTVHVADALQISQEEAIPILWEPPRGVFDEVVPTIRRRLTTQWQEGDDESGPALLSAGPLPDFVPRALFSELALPEVNILTPANKERSAEPETLPVAQAIREFIPGRVTRRYGSAHGLMRHWVSPGALLEGTEGRVDLDTWVVSGQDFGQISDQSDDYVVVRPWTIEVAEPPRTVYDSSNAVPLWQSCFRTSTPGLVLDVPAPSDWADAIHSIQVFSHNRSSSVDVTRAAVGSRTSIRLRDGSVLDKVLRFQWRSQPAALGFELGVDGIWVRLRLEQVWSLAFSEDELRSLRTARFTHEVSTDPILVDRAGSFAPMRLAAIYLSGLLRACHRRGLTIPEANDFLVREPGQLIEALDQVYGEDSEGGVNGSQERLHHDLQSLINDKAVLEILASHALYLSESPNPEWEQWLRGKFASTVGTAFVDACLRLLPNVATDDLTLDVSQSPDGEEIGFWITESSVGGAGVIEEFASEYSEDPRRFFQLVDVSLRPSDFEAIDRDLTRILAIIEAGDQEMLALLDKFRQARHPDTSRRHLLQLLLLLDRRGIATSHALTSALSSRLLRPGSDRASDQLLCVLVNEWHQYEKRFGIEVDFHVASYLLASSDGPREAMRELQVYRDDERWLVSTIQSLLWPRGWQLRASSHFSYNPFQVLPPTDRLLVERSLDRTKCVVDLAQRDWKPLLHKALHDHATVLAIDSDSNAKRLRQRLAEILSEPVDVGFMLVYPRVVGYERDPHLGVALEIEEAPQ